MLCSCSTEGTKVTGTGIRMRLSADSAAVELYSISPEILDMFKTAAPDEKQWQNFFAVYPLPADDALRDVQKPLAGTYLVTDSVIRFKPAQPFKPGRNYFAECYAKKYFIDPVDIVRNRKMPANVAPLSMEFRR